MPLLGRDLVSCTVYGGDADPATGVITWGTGVDLGLTTGSGAWKGLTIDQDRSGVDVSPSDALIATNLTERISFSFTVNEIQPANAAGALSALDQAGNQFVKVVAKYRKRGNSAGPYYRALIGRIGRISLPIDSGLNVGTMSGDSIGYAYVDGVTSLPSYFS